MDRRQEELFIRALHYYFLIKLMEEKSEEPQYTEVNAEFFKLLMAYEMRLNGIVEWKSMVDEAVNRIWEAEPNIRMQNGRIRLKSKGDMVFIPNDKQQPEIGIRFSKDKHPSCTMSVDALVQFLSLYLEEDIRIGLNERLVKVSRLLDEIFDIGMLTWEMMGERDVIYNRILLILTEAFQSAGTKKEFPMKFLSYFCGPRDYYMIQFTEKELKVTPFNIYHTLSRNAGKIVAEHPSAPLPEPTGIRSVEIRTNSSMEVKLNSCGWRFKIRIFTTAKKVAFQSLRVEVVVYSDVQEIF